MARASQFVDGCTIAADDVPKWDVSGLEKNFDTLFNVLQVTRFADLPGRACWRLSRMTKSPVLNASSVEGRGYK